MRRRAHRVAGRGYVVIAADAAFRRGSVVMADGLDKVWQIDERQVLAAIGAICRRARARAHLYCLRRRGWNTGRNVCLSFSKQTRIEKEGAHLAPLAPCFLRAQATLAMRRISVAPAAPRSVHRSTSDRSARRAPPGELVRQETAVYRLRSRTCASAAQTAHFVRREIVARRRACGRRGLFTRPLSRALSLSRCYDSPRARARFSESRRSLSLSLCRWRRGDAYDSKHISGARVGRRCERPSAGRRRPSTVSM